MKRILIFFIKCYQITPLSTHSMCRCYPTCSNYTILAINEYGAFKGLIMGIKRIIKCRPGGLYGYQPLEKGKIK